MGKRVRKTPEELRKAWEIRQEKIRNTIPQTFKHFCAQCQQTSVAYLNLRVYGQAKKNARTGKLKQRERLYRISAVEYEIRNDAKSADGYPYSVAQHEGRKAMSAPTSGGRKAFAWMINQAQKRPGPDDGKAWRELVRAGKAVVAPNVGPVTAKKWRVTMVAEMRGKFANLWKSEIFKIFQQS